DVTDLVAIAEAAIGAGADGLSLINTTLGMAIDPHTFRAKLGTGTGGLSGPAIRPIAIRCVWQVHQALPHVPIIGMGGIAGVDDASSLAQAIGDAAGAFKVGLQLFSAEGPAAVRALGDNRVFLDLKLNDIPNTVAGAVRAIAPLRVELLTVHALAGRAALEAANDAKREEKVLAVTVLTSFDDAACKEVGLP